MSRVVLVTGGSRGIGLACARAFAAQGDRVAVTYNTSPVDGFLAVKCDVRSTAEVDAVFQEVEAALGPVDVVVANAGVTRDNLLMAMSDEAFGDVIDVNLLGAARTARRACRSMVRRRSGRIVFVSSVAGLLGSGGQTNYAASKAGLIGLARSLAREVASRGITVNIVAPGPIATDLTGGLDESRRELLANLVPLGRMGLAEEVAAAIVYLASPGAAYVTGAVLPVDGGLGMGH